jgi:hypothetical protein
MKTSNDTMIHPFKVLLFVTAIWLRCYHQSFNTFLFLQLQTSTSVQLFNPPFLNQSSKQMAG